MGNATSGEDGGDYYQEEEDDYAKQFDGIDTLGYRVLGVQPDSPASKAGLVSFFDFIVGANHLMLMGSGAELKEGEEYNDVDFPRLLKENLNQSVLLLVWNIKAKEQRVVELVPSDTWGGAGLLGVTIKLDDYGGADERLVRVLEVDDTSSNGPAKLAGLIPQDDFLLGTTATTLTNTDVLASLLHHHLDRVVELYVYNSTTDLVRVVGLHPTYKWGIGESMLGAAVGTGYLHRLPQSCRTTIGKSVERTVRVEASSNIENEGGDGELNESNIRMEGTLELEVDEDGDDDAVDGDVGLASNRWKHVQPHQLGMPQTPTPQQQQQQQHQQGDDDGVKPDPPSAVERAAAAAAVVAQQQQHYQNEQHHQQPLPFPAADNKPPRHAPTITQQQQQQQQPEQQQQPPLVSNAFPPPPPVPEQQQQQPFPPPPPLLKNIQEREVPPSVADSAPIKPERAPSDMKQYPPPPSSPSPSASMPQSPPPTPTVVFPPPPPPPGPPSPDPPAEGDVYESEEGSEYTDEEGSEYTDDEDVPEAPKSGGFFGFMAPPPKMEF